jgi:hypothetical protein
MHVSLLADTAIAAMDDNTSIKRFGITPTKAEDFVKEQVQKAKTND